MMRGIIAFALLILSFGKLWAGDIPLEEIVSPKGVRFVFLRSDVQDTVAISIAFDHGMASDDISGPATYLLAPSMLLEGAGGKTASELYESFQDAGASFGIEATTDQTYASISAPTKGIEDAVKMVNFVMTKSDFPEKRFIRRRETLARRAEEAALMPETDLQRAFLSTAFDQHPYMRFFMPQAAEIRRVESKDLRPWINNHLAKQGILLTMVGNLDRTKAATLVDELLDGLPEKAALPPTPAMNFKPAPATKILVNGGQSDQATIMVGTAFPRAEKFENWLAGNTLSQIFSGDQKSRLFKDIREATAATYGMQPSTAFYEVLTTNAVSGRVAKNSVDATLAIINKSWQKFRAEGPTAEEIKNAKINQINSLNVMARNHAALASYLRDYLTGHWSVAQLSNLPSTIMRLNLSDTDVLAHFFAKEPIILVAQ